MDEHIEIHKKFGRETEELGTDGEFRKMKRYGNLFDKIVSYDNLVLAHKNASKGKSHYTEVKMVNENIEFYIKAIQETLINKTFTTSPYKVEERFDGRKKRTIHILPYYPDRIVQHAIIQICGPIWRKSFIRDTFQSIEGRGTFDAFKRVTKTVRNHKPKYFLKIDIEKFYPSINNNKLKQIVRRKIKCKDALWLIDDIIDSTKGIPIGNYTSQYFGNVYLSDFDWMMKQKHSLLGYYRYCDDIVFLSNDKHYLHTLKRNVTDFLHGILNLKIKPNWHISPLENQGLDFVGFVFRSTHTLLRKNISSNMKKKCSFIKRKHKTMRPITIVSTVMSYWGWIKYSNSKNLWRYVVDDCLINIVDNSREKLKNA